LLMSSMAYLLVWLLLNGAFETDLTFIALYFDMWESARALHAESIFLHRSVFLAFFFAVLTVFAAVRMVASKLRKGPPISSGS
jgi:uncharacterized membrane protein